MFSRTDTVFEKKLATAKSGMPSPLRSPTATQSGAEPVLKSSLGEKLGVTDPGAVVFKRTDTRFDPVSATAKSGLLSPLKSPTATQLGSDPVA